MIYTFEGSEPKRGFTDQKVRGSEPTSASRLTLSRLGQIGSIPNLVLPLDSMVARHRKDVTAEQFRFRDQSSRALSALGRERGQPSQEGYSTQQLPEMRKKFA
ncbi:hypothetical protein CSKR_100851 [Clonorchis sinensis]|uniref:Uncharacterized protein n=1 Tax=Clonorchis sinensis TaxID=79923 RepID=A0A3R7HB56_CLOSI|nr:hypothetical protein CSKR_100851 [Clonorchis sinensis]